MAGELADNEWRQVLELAQTAADLPQEERRRYVESITADRRVVERTLQLADEFAAQSQSPVLEVHSQLGRFTITKFIGRGGLGQVFLASDPELDRPVALKVLHGELHDAPASSKLLQEARTASALNHPNILTIYEVLKIGSLVAIVMEFVPGDSLGSWIGTPHSLAESLAVMVQMASAVEAAHAAGIVHRDLKPENVIVRADKRLKVLDFGLAKSINVEAEAGHSMSVSNLAGTLPYMSPEQWAGAPLDASSDIFSLGVVFYEIVTGRHPFKLPSGIDLMKAMAAENPPRPSTWNSEIPPPLDELIMQMLAKPPAKRPTAFQTLAAVTTIQCNLRDHQARGEAAESSLLRRTIWVAALLAVLLAVAGIWRLRRSGLSADRSHIPEEVTLLPLANELGYYNSPTFSPDGRQVAYSWNGKKQDNFDIYSEIVDSRQSRRLTSGPEADYSPAWSPDGKTIAFCRDSKAGNAAIWIMPALGGSEKKVFDLHWRADYGNRHLSWSPDSRRITFTDRRPTGSETNAIFELDLASGATKQITFPTGPQIDLQPAYSPDGSLLAFIRDLGGGVNRLYLLPLTGTRAPYPVEWDGLKNVNVGREVWTPDSQVLLFITNPGVDAHLWAGKAAGHFKPRLLASFGSNIYDTDLSRTGRLAAVNQHYDSDIYKIDLHRSVRAIAEPVVNSTRLELNPKISPDGRKIAFESNRSGYMEIWTANTDGSNPIPLTEMQAPTTGSPSWSHNGQHLTFDSRRGGSPRLYLIDASAGKPRALTSNIDAVVPAWSADDAWIYFSSDRSGNWEIWRIQSSGGKPERVTRNGGFAACLSPDGAWLYYASDRSKITELRALNLQTQKEVVISSDVLRRNYTAASNGLYYVSRDSSGRRELKWIDKFGRTKSISHFDMPLSDGLDVSPDGLTLYFGQLDQDGTELMLVNSFWR